MGASSFEGFKFSERVAAESYNRRHLAVQKEYVKQEYVKQEYVKQEYVKEE